MKNMVLMAIGMLLGGIFMAINIDYKEKQKNKKINKYQK